MLHNYPNIALRTNTLHTCCEQQRGFTLIELMVVLVITGVLMAIAIPNFARATRSIQLEHQAKEMAGAIKLARAEAMRRGQIVVMCRSNTDQTACKSGSPTQQWALGWLVFVDLDNSNDYNAADVTPTDNGLISIKQAMPVGIDAFTSNGSPAGLIISFNAAGEPFGALGNTITFSYKDDPNNTHIILVISSAGRVRIMTYEQWLNNSQ